MDINVQEKLYKQIVEYCNINELDINEYTNNLLSKAFMEDKYGTAPPFLQKKEVEISHEVKEEPKPEVKVIVVEEPVHKNDMFTNNEQTEKGEQGEIKVTEEKVIKKTRRRKLT